MLPRPPRLPRSSCGPGWILAAALPLLGCGARPTAILVVVESDLAIPADTDGLQFVVTTGAGGRLDRVYPLGTRSFPVSLSLRPAGREDDTVTIVVTATLGAANVVSRTRRDRFEPGVDKDVVVWLERACIGVTCPTGLECDRGRCVDNDGGTDGGDAEVPDCTGVDLNTSVDHCGACGRACVADGRVALVSCYGGVCASSCASGFGNCAQPAAPSPDDGCEIDLFTSPTHCGGCGRACAADNAAVLSCVDGLCASSCLGGFGNCVRPPAPAADDGCESNLGSSATHCGVCGRGCSPDNVTVRRCTGGLCAPTCAPGFGNCAAPAAPASDDGCEIDLTADPLNCGSCGRSCDPTGTTGVFCTGGLCTPSCDGGRGNCSLPAAPALDDGCESDLSASTAHCGSCGRACSPAGAATLACTAGLCTPVCLGGRTDCTEPVAPSTDDGCESDLATSPTHCGACGRPCASANVASLGCSGGACTSPCAPGWGNCSQPPAPSADDGCETAVGSDPANCGGCGRACSAANVSALVCSAGLCASTCLAGLTNCTLPAAPAPDDGCEADLASSTGHCGACSRACSAVNVGTLACSAGLCSSTCVRPTLGNCSQPAAPAADDGCETDLWAGCSSCPCASASFGENAADTYRTVTRDTYLDSGNTTLNYGAMTLLLGDGAPVLVALLRFDLSAIPPTATVLAARLRLSNGGDPSTDTFYVQEVLEDWQEGTGNPPAAGVANWSWRLPAATWSNPGCGEPLSRSTAVMASFVPTGIAGTAYWIDLDPAVVQRWVSGAGNFGLAVRDATGINGAYFRSRETILDGQRPSLQVIWQP